MGFFDISNTAFRLISYEVSYVELIAVLSGLASVWFASKAKILTWPTGIINEFFLFLLFFQVQLYADMLLQVFFFITTVYGWYNWRRPAIAHRILRLNKSQQLWYAVSIVVGSIAAGFLIANLHTLLPTYFKTLASYPFIDSVIMVLSIAATILLAKKKLENWF